MIKDRFLFNRFKALVLCLLLALANPSFAFWKLGKNKADDAHLLVEQELIQKGYIDEQLEKEFSYRPVTTRKLIEPKIKASIQYEVEKGYKIPLRVTFMPSKYPWLERDDKGHIKPPEVASVIVTQNIEDVILEGGIDNQKLMIPKGSKFHARVKEVVKNKSFLRDGYVVLEFFKLEVPGGAVPIEANSDTKDRSIKNKLRKAGKVSAYTAGGAIAGPIITYIILSKASLFGLAVASNPYVIGGSAAVGGAIGFAIGISRKGKFNTIVPGAELNLNLGNTWVLQLSESIAKINEKNASKLAQIQKAKKRYPVDLEVLSVKKIKSVFGGGGLAVKFQYKNKTREQLRFTSFKLYDSMGKEYDVEPKNINDDIIGTVPKEGEITLHFGVDFPKAIHTLKILRPFNRKVMANAEVILL